MGTKGPMRNVQLTEFDLEIYEREIRPLLPEQVFDAHCHLLINQFHPRLAETLPLALDPLLNEVDLPWLEAWWRALFPGIEVSGMLMGFPTLDVDMAGENGMVARSANEKGWPFALLVRPEMPAVDLERDIQSLNPSVLKPAQASITDMLPEEQIALADKYGLAVMLHVSKPRGMADAENLDDITRLIRDYPHCQFILAHCGRCFIPPNMDDALKRLPAAENLWLDTSAVCDIGVFLSLFSRYDRSRILFGTDLVTAAAFRGSYVRLGMSWHVCTDAMVARAGGMAAKSTFAAYESLCALCYAVRFLGLSEAERWDLFFQNAAQLYRAGAALPRGEALPS
ncbi:MAG: amidohydrolase family protein [Candidatus Hydrogenedentes bacterium]|nr:amidohydrolase family protein [Candidatus Hydrogenedentota bacterium]